MAKVDGDAAVKAKAALVVNGTLRRRVNHGNGGKVGGDGRAAVDNRQQWQRQSGNNQLKVTVACSGVDSCEGGSKQQQSTAIGCKMSRAKAIIVAPRTPLLSSLAGGGRWTAVAVARE